MMHKPALAAAAAVILAGLTACSASGAGSGTGGPAPDYSHPLGPHEKQATLAQAASSAGYPVKVPSAGLANAKTLTRVYVSPPHQVALVFDHGRVTVMMWPAIYHDPLSFFKQSRTGINAKTEITQVNGHPMLVIFPHTDPARPNPAWVEFDLGGVNTNVVSQTYGTAALLAIARSMT